MTEPQKSRLAETVCLFVLLVASSIAIGGVVFLGAVLLGGASWLL